MLVQATAPWVPASEKNRTPVGLPVAARTPVSPGVWRPSEGPNESRELIHVGKKKGHVPENSVIAGKVTHKLLSGTPIDTSCDARGPRRAISKRAEPTGCLLVPRVAGLGRTSRPGRILTPISQPRTLRLSAASSWSRP